MRPSTFIELAGFGLIAFAVYSWNAAAGLAVGGALLLVIGYATEDRAAVLALRGALRAVRRPRKK